MSGHTKTAASKATMICLGATGQQGKDHHSCAKVYHSRLEDANPTEGVGSKFPVSSLSLEAHEALERSLQQGWDATWSDEAGVTSAGVTAKAEAMGRILKNTSHLFFAGVAFKYQQFDPNPAQAARLAWSLGMIPTTSGARTGEPPQATKLQQMKEGATYPLAVASGLSPDNIGELAPWIEHALVATGVSVDFHHFDPRQLKEFRDRFLTIDKNIMLATQPKF